MIDIIIGSQFPKKVIPLIDEAKKSLKIVVFDWRWYPNDPAAAVQLFNQSIIRACRRSVDVSVVCNVDSIFPFLKPQGIKCHHSTSKSVMHAKMMIIDDEILVTGSHNYTQAAFTMNQELSIIYQGGDVILPALDFFKTLLLI